MTDAGQTGAPAAGQQGTGAEGGQQGAADQQGQQAAQQGAQQTNAPQGGQQGAPGTPAPQAGAQGAPQQQGQQGAQSNLDWSQVPAEYRAAFEAENARNYRLQQENGNERVNAKNTARDEGMQQAIRAMAKAVGIDLPDDSAPTIEGVQAELTEAATQRDNALKSAALTDAAFTENVDPAKRAYVEFLLAKDTSLPVPTDAGYAAKVSEAVAALVAADPTLRRSGTVQAAGVENHGGANGNDDITQEQFAAMSMGQKTELFRDHPDTYARLSGRA